MTRAVDATDPALAARLDAWLDAALDLDADGRAALVASVRAGDAHAGDLLARLVAGLSAPSSLDRPPLLRDTPAARGAAEPYAAGSMLGPWRINGPAGSGGMSRVYRAERADGAYAQAVALKVLDTADPELARRFSTERALLASLEHPHIARLIDGGTTADGRLWFAMAWIEGRDLDAHLAAERPSLVARLDLFNQVAEAVAHAHRRLVVHRDLKPSNVRVTAEGRAVLLDFGIAKLVAGAEDLRTRALMTPAYAAPEQLADGPIGTWTDVHGLGVLLHEMLSGCHPYPTARESLAAAVQAIVGGMPESASVAAARARLPYPARALAGDLDAIVARCLDQDPARRYASVDALLDDLDRHRRLLPVAARRGARRYRAGRWLRRNWLPATLASAVLTSAAVGLAAFVLQARQVEAERDAAQLEVRRQEALREHLMLVFREGAGQGGVTAKQLLDASAAQLDQLYGDDPALRRSVLLAMGELYFTLGDFPASRAMVERFLAAAGADTPVDDRVLGHVQLAQVLLRLGDADGARATLAAADALHVPRPGAPRDLDGQRLAAASQLARAEGDLERGLALQREVVAVTAVASDGSPHRLGVAESNLGMALLQVNRLDEAEAHFRAALESFTAAGYARSVHAITTLGNLANVESLLGRLAEADRHYREAAALASAATAESATMAALLQNHARLLLTLDRLAEARPQVERALALAERYIGADSVDAAGIRLTLAEIALASGDIAGAQAAITSAEAIYAARLPAAHPLRARAALVAARVALALDADAALVPLEDAVVRLAAAPALLARQSVRGSIWLAEAALARGRGDLARSALQRAATLPVHADLPAWEQAELRLWQAVAAGADTLTTTDRAALVAALGATHTRVRVLDVAAARGASAEAARSASGAP
jgi:non-specific serine/threonine protein kinase/serine/threonine-protein kinase